MYPKTMDDLRNLRLNDVIVTLASGNADIDTQLINSIQSSDRTPFVLKFEGDQKGNLVYEQDGIYYQSFSLDNILATVSANASSTINNAKNTFGYFLLLYSLSVARAESMASSNILLPSTFFPTGLSDLSSFGKALQRVIDEGTIKGTNISLELMLFDQRLNDYNKRNLTEDKVVTLISGGTDSIGVGYIEKGLGKVVMPTQILYDQAARHQELWCVDRIVEDLDVKITDVCRVHLPMLRTFGGSALLRDDIKITEENRSIEYVPFRNTVLLAVALMRAELAGAKYVAIGANHDDTLAPDGTPSYINSINNLIRTINLEIPFVVAPFLGFGGKPEVIRTGLDLGVNYSHTWSCHAYIPPEQVGEYAKACGTCGNCSTRYSAFKLLRLEDPVTYKEVPVLRTKWAGPQENYESLRKSLGLK